MQTHICALRASLQCALYKADATYTCNAMLCSKSTAGTLMSATDPGRSKQSQGRCKHPTAHSWKHVKHQPEQVAVHLGSNTNMNVCTCDAMACFESYTVQVLMTACMPARTWSKLPKAHKPPFDEINSAMDSFVRYPLLSLPHYVK